MKIDKFGEGEHLIIIDFSIENGLHILKNEKFCLYVLIIIEFSLSDLEKIVLM